MTNDEIIKRLAEIEGIDLKVDEEIALTHGRYKWNPLDWADLGPLIEKYKVSPNWLPSDINGFGEEHGLIWECEVWDYSKPEQYEYLTTIQDKSIKRVCGLAIIEANQ